MFKTFPLPVLALISGTLFGVGFVVPFLWPLALVGLAPLIVSVKRARSMKEAFALGWIAGLLVNLFGSFSVFWMILPLDWLGGLFPLWFDVGVMGFSWLLTASGMALAYGFFAIGTKIFLRDAWFDLIYIPALWILAEWSAAVWFSIQNLGPATKLSETFSISFIGNQVAHSSALIQLAWFGGVYTLSAFAALCGVIAYRALGATGQERSRIAFGFAAALVVLGIAEFAIIMMPPVTGENPVSVAAISLQGRPALSPSKEDKKAAMRQVLSTLADTRGADFVLIPENTGFLPLYREHFATSSEDFLLSKYTGKRPPVFVDSSLIQGKFGKYKAQMELFDADKNSSVVSFKRFLLPAGEYIPYIYEQPVRLIGQGGALDTVHQHRAYAAGKPPTSLDVRGMKIGSLFCNESMSPSMYRSLAAGGAEVLFNIASHAWFHGSRMVAEQMHTMARIRAVETRRWYVQATSVAPSFALDPYGRTVISSEWGSEGPLLTTIYRRNDTTLYVLLGPWMLLVALGLIIGRSSHRFLRRRTENK